MGQVSTGLIRTATFLPEVLVMDIEDRLKQLQLILSHAISSADLAKTRYLAALAELEGHQIPRKRGSVSGSAWRNYLRSKVERARPVSRIEDSWHTPRNWWVPI